jgi:hypothetical protein
LDEIGITGQFGGGSNNGTAVTTPNGATAASCNKGYFWPFYRSSGDCLTDIEKKNGRSGVYGGGTGITPAGASSTVTSGPPAAPTPTASAITVTPGPTAGGAATDTSGGATCHKGLLWPFVRDSGDCPTDAEKKSGERVAPAAFRSNGITSAPPAAAAAAPSSGTQATSGAPIHDASATASCRNGLLSFLLDDCRTNSENKVTTVPVSAQMPAATASSGGNTQATSGSVPANDTTAANCRKGILWPFIRGSADCPTADDKKIGRSTFDPSAVTPAAASASTVTAAPERAEATPVSMSGGAPSGAAPASDAGTAGCSKGLLWPFVRGAGDCPTDDERAGRR